MHANSNLQYSDKNNVVRFPNPLWKCKWIRDWGAWLVARTTEDLVRISPPPCFKVVRCTLSVVFLSNRCGSVMAIRKTYTGLHLFTLANKLCFCFSSTSFETFSRELGQHCELVTKLSSNQGHINKQQTEYLMFELLMCQETDTMQFLPELSAVD